MERSSESVLVGKSEEGSGIYRTIKASNHAGINNTIRDEEELEELESRVNRSLSIVLRVVSMG